MSNGKSSVGAGSSGVAAARTPINSERMQEWARVTRELRHFLDTAGIATLFLDEDLRVITFTPAVMAVLDLSDHDVGLPVTDVRAHVPIDGLAEDIRRVRDTREKIERRMASPDGRTRHFARIVPFRDAAEIVAGVVVTFIDVSHLIREERQRLLLSELQHRVRNTLGVVRSIARRSAETSTSVEEYAQHLDGRLPAFARTQALVTRNPDAGVDLEYLAAEELRAFQAREGEQVDLGGPLVQLQSKAAETVGLAIHELATNAVKYGALRGLEGRVRLSWSIDRSAEPPLLRLEWIERNGPPVEPPRRRGFGTELLERTLTYELQAVTDLRFDRPGLTCRIAIPLGSEVVAAFP